MDVKDRTELTRPGEAQAPFVNGRGPARGRGAAGAPRGSRAAPRWGRWRVELGEVGSGDGGQGGAVSPGRTGAAGMVDQVGSRDLPRHLAAGGPLVRRPRPIGD